MTYGELVRAYFPEATDEECEYIIWEKTAYPCADDIYCEQQLSEFAGVPNKRIVEKAFNDGMQKGGGDE